MWFLLNSIKYCRLLSYVYIDVEQPKIRVTLIVDTLGPGYVMLTSEMVRSAEYKVIRMLDSIRPGTWREHGIWINGLQI